MAPTPNHPTPNGTAAADAARRRAGRSNEYREARDEYAAIRSLQRRFRALPIALGVVVAGLAITFTLTGNILGVFFLMPVAIVAWFVFLRPTHRRRYREAIAELQRWDLRAEP